MSCFSLQNHFPLLQKVQIFLLLPPPLNISLVKFSIQGSGQQGGPDPLLVSEEPSFTGLQLGLSDTRTKRVTDDHIHFSNLQPSSGLPVCHTTVLPRLQFLTLEQSLLSREAYYYYVSFLIHSLFFPRADKLIMFKKTVLSFLCVCFTVSQPSLQYSCLEKSLDRGDRWLQSMGLHRVRHDFTFTFSPSISP